MNLPACLLAALSLLLDPSVFVCAAAAGHEGTPVGTARAVPAAERDAPGVPLVLNGLGKSVEEAATGLVNEVKASRLVTLEFRVTDAHQQGVFLPELLVGGTVTTGETAQSREESDAFEAGAHEVPVYMGNGYYRVRWQTCAAWANTTRTLTLSFEAVGHSFAKADGTALQARFRFHR